jgi:hypothetical protein
MDGLDSAARAIMTDDTPVFARIASQFAHPSPSPLHTTGTPLLRPSSTISPNLSQRALTELLISLVLQCTVKHLTPVRRIRAARWSVEGCSGSNLILHEMGSGISRRSARRMSSKRSGVESKAAPMPECTLKRNHLDRQRPPCSVRQLHPSTHENGFGHPQFRSLPTNPKDPRSALVAFRRSRPNTHNPATSCWTTLAA